MARPLRIEFPGAIFHITSRGNARAAIYLDDDDREEFLAVLGDVVARFNWLCHAYCLMGNHYHVLVETVDGNLSQGMRQLNGVYTQRFNRSHNRVGHIFQGRYKSILVERDSYLLELCRYIVLNPVRAGITDAPGRYRWSSYRATAGSVKRPSFLTVDWILRRFASRRSDARKRYRSFVLAGVGGQSPWIELTAQCILGGREFIEKISPALKEKSTLLEVPRQERFAFRPPLGDLMGAHVLKSKAQRNQVIAVAHLEYGYALSEIAKQVGLHYTTVSKILEKHLKTL
jgi:REP element-mobilizing transposase RayT